jgi:hypothetical protein
MAKNEIYCQYADGVFTPEEVEAMTGIAPVTQRTWNARGLLMERKAGRGRFSAHEVAHLWALQVASLSLRVELTFMYKAIVDAVPSILWWALSDESAWDYEGNSEQKAAFKRALASPNKEGLPLLDQAVGVKRDMFGRYLVRSADDWKLVYDMEHFFSAEEDQAALVLDLFAVSNKIVASPRRPRGLMVASEISNAPSPLRAPIEKKVRRK